jgi:hypothetical protein
MARTLLLKRGGRPFRTGVTRVYLSLMRTAVGRAEGPTLVQLWAGTLHPHSTAVSFATDWVARGLELKPTHSAHFSPAGLRRRAGVLCAVHRRSQRLPESSRAASDPGWLPGSKVSSTSRRGSGDRAPRCQHVDHRIGAAPLRGAPYRPERASDTTGRSLHDLDASRIVRWPAWALGSDSPEAR